MAIRQLKPYLKNIADAIREKAVAKGNLIDFRTARNRDNYTGGVFTFTDTGFTYEGNYWFSYDVNLKGGKTYILSGSYYVVDSTVTPVYHCYSADGTKVASANINKPITPTSDVVRIDIFSIPGYTSLFTATYNNLMLEEVPPNINAQDFPDKVTEVYDKGVFDRDVLIWNMISDNNTRVNYHNAFQYTNMSGYQFIKPLTPTGYISQLFYSCYNMTSVPTPLNFSKIFSNGGDTGSSYRKSVFAYCKKLEFVPDLNMKAIGGLEEWFLQCYKLHTIELLRVRRDTVYTNTFNSCEYLQNINFDGEIGQSISFKDSPLLSVESQINIIKHLVDFSGTSDAGTRILTIHPTAFERLNATYSTPEEVGIPFFGSWLSYINSIGWDM
jgi:hypothetical protein